MKSQQRNSEPNRAVKSPKRQPMRNLPVAQIRRHVQTLDARIDRLERMQEANYLGRDGMLIGIWRSRTIRRLERERAQALGALKRGPK